MQCGDDGPGLGQRQLAPAGRNSQHFHIDSICVIFPTSQVAFSVFERRCIINMNRFKRVVLWAALIAIVLLVLLSIYGAFLGAERAQAFFNPCRWRCIGSPSSPC